MTPLSTVDDLVVCLAGSVLYSRMLKTRTSSSTLLALPVMSSDIKLSLYNSVRPDEREYFNRLYNEIEEKKEQINKIVLSTIEFTIP